MNRYRWNGGQNKKPYYQKRRQFFPQQRRQEEAKIWDWRKKGIRNDWGYKNFDNFDYSRFAHKFYRPKQQEKMAMGEKEAAKKGSQSKVDNATYEVMSIIRISNENWLESVNEMKEKAFFFKWLGPWPSVSIIRQGSRSLWGVECRFKTLANGFYLGIAPSRADKANILKKGPYLLEGKGIILKEWTPNFDPTKEKVQSFPIWINLHNLPVEYWGEKVMEEIGNTIGEYVRSEVVLNKVDSSSHPRLLIMLKEGNPCPDYVNLSTEYGVWEQPVEKWEGEDKNNPEEESWNISNRRGKGLEDDKILDFLEMGEGQKLQTQNPKDQIPTNIEEELQDHPVQSEGREVQNREEEEGFKRITENSTQRVLETPWEEECDLREMEVQRNFQGMDGDQQGMNDNPINLRRCSARIGESSKQEMQSQEGGGNGECETPSNKDLEGKGDTICKDIEVSPERNLSVSFEEALDSSSGMEEMSLPLEEDLLNDLGLSEMPGIQAERSLEQTSSKKQKPNVGSQKKRGPKPVKVKLALAGKDASQTKILRSGKGLAFSREP